MLFDHPEFDGHEHVSMFCDERAGLRAIIAIHTTAPFGVSGGGCRMWPYETDADALRDALRLSRHMSYKLALAEMPAGGAKAVVIGDSQTDKTPELLRSLGQAVASLGGRYVIAEDVGTTPEDMRIMRELTPYVSGRHVDTSPPTAHGVFAGLKEAVRRRLDRDLEGVVVAVQGVGHVGAMLCDLLAAEGAELVVADVNADRASGVAARLSARVVPSHAIARQDVDVFAPCALGDVVTERSLAEMTCTVIAGSANNQLAAEPLADELVRRGILYAPDFVINLGGVIGAAHEGVQLGDDSGFTFDPEAVARDAARVGEILRQVFDRAEAERINPHRAAVAMAKEALAARRR